MPPDNLTADELAAAKAYMRVEEDDDDVLISSLVTAHRAYMTGAGISLPAVNTARRAQYDMVVHAMTLAVYDNRSLTAEKVMADNPVLARTITQLKWTEETSE